MANLIIIPTYLESENIEAITRTIFSLSIPFSILVIDDNSADGTAAIVKNLQTEFKNLHLIERPGKLGLGTAYITGFRWALENDFDYIFEMDADFSHNPDDLIRLYSACHDDGADVAIGSRYISGVNVVNWPLSRVLMSYFASVYVRIITRMNVKDTTAGFICYRSEVLRNIHLEHIRSKGYGFQIEMKFAAWKLGYKIVEVPIIFTDRKLGTSKMSGGVFNEALWGVIRMKIRSWFMKYSPGGAGMTADAETEKEDDKKKD
ncbi:MAG TPA: polyprenol monophosphomannose synthase [Bacteroidales bacterium]|mgnify:CR=1 FL=1|jgi:dolichol-phosphate mannosyltransferase|nr:polyprenol monophosphomannose synthase [Bacteroidales bacterium]HOS71230.1 polyprenol monophosphomannose synthase [Bacteroidales bacterium]HQH24342.1 polyprenol monophosphomannose synthase [Bacteroidales bacterium]HQJ81577.1 polyprenol monophosphomannose synthase [Bacteroidales bacterium]